MRERATVLIGCGSRILREALTMAIGSQSQWQVVGNAEDSHTAIRLTRDLQPQVAVLCAALPKEGTLSTARRISDEPGQPTKLIICSPYPFRISPFDAYEAGASGLLREKAGTADLLAALEAVLGDELYFPSEEGQEGSPVDDPSERGPSSWPPQPGTGVLTSREMEVLNLLSNGLRTSEIAQSLFISEKTVESHRGRIMKKLGIHTIAGLTRHAILRGLVSLETENHR